MTRDAIVDPRFPYEKRRRRRNLYNETLHEGIFPEIFFFAKLMKKKSRVQYVSPLFPFGIYCVLMSR